ncbi:WG repeat-containing protein [Flavobacterium sp. I-SCBP12n]|uniref:WG repeat-containing protein n=1 Tax=Flavobacterium pygoscelis TaxID=2893176 RepID=A0A9X2BLZ9_9FLAO|nr:WG repeat-containing protein [Flavobacterium pygoscelis]MCK8142567.1 WG repeat-containing protein [Flavobacterium pygoscelis]
MKIFKLFILLFPFLSFSQNKFEFIREKLMQNKKYEYVYGFENNFAVFRTFDKKMGVIDSTENIIIKPIFSFIYNKKQLKNLFEVGNEINKKFKRGFIDLKGNIKIPIIYDNVIYLENGLIRVEKANKIGILDTLNNVILPTKFDNISVDNNLIIAEIKALSTLYNFQGKQISNIQFTQISEFKNNNAIVDFPNKTTSIIDNNGNIILKSIKNYNFERIFNHNLYLIKNNLTSKIGIINSKNEFIINCKYDEIKQVNSFFIAKSNKKNGFISSTDSIIKPFVYDEIYFSYFDDAVIFGDNNIGENYVVKKDNLFGVINPNIVNDIIAMNYKSIRTLFDNYYIVENNENKNGLFTKSGKRILNENYEFYNVYKNSIFATKENKQYIINLEEDKHYEKEINVNEFVKFKDVQQFSKNENQIIKNENKFGVINSTGKIIIPCDYDYIENIYLSKEYVVKKNNKFGIINSVNKIVVEIEYDNFKKLKESILFTENNKTKKKYHEITL